MNTVFCSCCGEVALKSPLSAESLEGLGYSCGPCGAFGRVVIREHDDGQLRSLELRVKLGPCGRCPEGDCDCEDPAVVGGYPA